MRHYYLISKDELMKGAGVARIEGHYIDEHSLITVVEFSDPGQRQRFESRPTVEALPDSRSGAALSSKHVARLAKYGVVAGHTSLDVSDRLAAVAGHYMRL